MITFVKAGMNILSFQRERQMHAWAFLQVMRPSLQDSLSFFYLHIFPYLSPVYTTDVSFPSLVAHWRCCVQPTQVPLCRPRQLSWLRWLMNKTSNRWVLLRVTYFSSVQSATYRKSLCTDVNITQVNLSKAPSSLTSLACVNGVPESLWMLSHL